MHRSRLGPHPRTVSGVTLLLVAALAMPAWAQSAAASRQEVLRRARADKAAALHAYAPGRLERWLSSLENEQTIENLFEVPSRLDWGKGFKTPASFGLYRRPWLRVRYPDTPRSVGRFEAESFDPLAWRPEYPNPAFRNLMLDDAYWAATLNPVDSPQLDVQPTQPTAAVPGISRRIEAATEARELAEERLAIEQSRFAAGLRTNFFVVQAQRDLATAKDTELRAILDHQKALVEFERVQRTSLSQPLISIVR